MPLQWIETGRDEHWRRADGLYAAPDFRSLLVSRGVLEDSGGARSASPTCDIEGHNLLLSWPACEKIRIKAGDISNACFQRLLVDRLILLKPPPGGLPDPEMDDETMLIARVPIHGDMEAGRGFWK